MTRGGTIEKPINGPPGRPVVRFAPSPNGRLHLGHAYSALFCFEVARALGARFLLRIEDIDQSRARDEFIEAIFDDLAWLGLTWETPVRRQSEHLADYKQALEQLSKAGLLYASTTTRAEIRALTKQMSADGAAPARDPDGAPLLARKVLENAGATPGQPKAMRLDAARALKTSPALTFREIGPGHPSGAAPIAARPDRWGDAVIGRKDIAVSYHLAVVVDDALQGVTHITRGLDLFPATDLHRLLQWHLRLPQPVYCHHRLIVGDDGHKLAKSAGAPGLAALRQAGATPEAIRKRIGIDKLAPYFAQLAATHNAR